jgi:hypothetical protein
LKPDDWMGGKLHASAALPPGTTRYPVYERLGGTQGWSDQGWEISPPPRFDPWTVQPIAIRYPGPISTHSYAV